MKKTLVTTLIALPLLGLSSMAFADEPAAGQPMQLSATQMDGVTAGGRMGWRMPSFVYHPVQVNQINNASNTILQIGNNNFAFVFSPTVFINL